MQPTQRFNQLKSILTSGLKYGEISHRHERITKAFASTFEWIFQQPDREGTTATWANFREWLEEGKGIYWITGKPGSGKSTLMKFIHDNLLTDSCLRVWAQEKPFLRGRFYFWNSGAPIQMSIEGLYKALAYEVLSELEDESCIRFLCPERWEIASLFEQADPEPWKAAECESILRKLTDGRLSNHRIFFLIDGLDEFSGDQKLLLDFIQHLGQVPHIKVCCASRPWVEFQDAFHQAPSLRVQQLTGPDIKHYISTKFGSHPSMNGWRACYPNAIESIAEDINERSSGVFLWVVLVVQSLLSGVSSGDRISDLQARLNELPPDLDKLFSKILKSMSQRYQSHASQIFQIHSASNADINLITLSFADDIDHIRLVSNKPIHYRRGNRENRCEMMYRRLASRTKGLLEAGPQTSGSESPKVQYLHRTVRDYFSIPQVWNNIVSMVDATFNPHFALVAAFCAFLKTREPWYLLDQSDDQSRFILDQLTSSLVKCRPENHAVLVPVLDALDQFISLAPMGRPDRKASLCARFLPIGVLLGLGFWVKPTLQRDLASTNTASLWACFGEVLNWHSRYKIRCIGTVRMLLEFAL